MTGYMTFYETIKNLCEKTEGGHGPLPPNGCDLELKRLSIIINHILIRDVSHLNRLHEL